MILWSVQDIAAYKELEKHGTYSVPDEHIWLPEQDDNNRWHGNYAYKWLAKRMEEMIGPPPEGVHYPVWGFYRYYGRGDGKPDMRSYARDKTWECVRFKLDIPDWLVVLSDMD